jgi:dTDP-4-amino-4,6-dideoxygalactose transaminase
LHIPFNRPLAVGDEIDYIRAAIARPKFCFTASCVLRAQLEHRDQIQSARRWLWENYMRELSGSATNNGVQLPTIPPECEQS